MMGRALVTHQDEDLVGMHNLGTVKYSFFLWSDLGMHMLKLNRYLLLQTSN
jgi:hypothetical protein